MAIIDAMASLCGGLRMIGAVVLSAFALTAAPVAAAETPFEFHLRSDPGDYVGDGGTYVRTQFTGEIDKINLGVKADGGVDLVELRYVGSASPGTQFMHFAIDTTQLGSALRAGTYLEAQRARMASAGHPGLDVSVDSRGCNTISGSFVIRDIRFTAGTVPALEVLDLDFEQHCNDAQPALRGTVRYGIHSPLAPPGIPSLQWPALLGLAAAVASVGALARRRESLARCFAFL